MDKDRARIQSDFFNGLAPEWRKNEQDPSPIIQRLLNEINFREGEKVLDVACGAGVLDKFLVERKAEVIALDVSEKMIERANAENAHLPVRFIVADFYRFDENEKYDKIIIFDAYPHFTDKSAFEQKCFELTSNKGEVWIMFDQTKEEINSHHHGLHSDISVPLLSVEEECERFSERFEVIKAQESDVYILGLRKK